jgi:hypothetical protein
VPDLCAYDYATIRLVPKVERGEFVNVGVIVSCPTQKVLEARIELDDARALALDPTLDLDAVRVYLQTIPTICAGGVQAGPIGQLSQRQRFYWLVSPRSTIIQTSPVHSGLCSDPEALIKHLLDTMVRIVPIKPAVL